MSPNRQTTLNANCRGFTLIEVLVALLVLSIGIFGLIALQTQALKYNQDAYLRSQAAILINDMADKIRSNRSVDYYSQSAGSSTACVSYTSSTASCSATQIAQRDLYDWEADISAILPSGSGDVSLTASGAIQITVEWDDDRDSATSEASVSVEFDL